jgi:hypothetical protein
VAGFAASRQDDLGVDAYIVELLVRWCGDFWTGKDSVSVSLLTLGWASNMLLRTFHHSVSSSHHCSDRITVSIRVDEEDVK